jgi:hypothetical protein
MTAESGVADDKEELEKRVLRASSRMKVPSSAFADFGIEFLGVFVDHSAIVYKHGTRFFLRKGTTSRSQRVVRHGLETEHQRY